jgi:Na+/melibiose symporter-like transporter
MEQKLSLKEKISYSVGAIPNGFFGIFLGAIQAFYYSWMGLDIKNGTCILFIHMSLECATSRL